MLAWSPFLDPIPVWSNAVWPWLILPLAAGVSIVYKSIKCRSMRDVPREALGITTWIILGMIVAAIALAVVVRVLER
jgi:hypothetical protein